MPTIFLLLQDANTDTLHLLRLLNGEYRFRLTVTDLAGQSNSTEVNFTVSRDHSTIGESQMLAIGRASYPDLQWEGGRGGPAWA